MKETRKQVRLNRDASRRVKLFKTHKGWMTMGVTTLAMAAGVITLGANANDVSAATWKTRSVSEIADQIKTAADKTTYTIKWGDTLGTIAQALKNSGINTSAERLAEINHIAKADLIYAGNKLTFTGTGDAAVTTVKEADGKTTSYNLDPNKSTKATKTDVEEAKKSQTTAASTTTDSASTSTATATTSAATKAKQEALKTKVVALGATTTTTANGQLQITLPKTANSAFENAIKAKGYTFTKDADSKYSFEIAGASAGDIEAINSVIKYYGVTNYQFTKNGVVTDENTDAESTTATADDSTADTTTTTTSDDTADTDSDATSTSASTTSASSSSATSTSSTSSSTKAATPAPAKTTTATSAKTTSTSTTKAATPAKTTTTSSSVKKTTTTTTAKKTTTPKKTVAVSKPKTTTTSTSTSRAAKVQAVISTAKAQIGKPYKHGAKGPSSFDCSGLISYVWKQALGSSAMNWNSASQSYKGTKVSLKAAQPGDLIFWSSNGSNTGVYHVAIYIGNGQYIVAPHTGTDVQIQTISSYFQPSFAKRVL